MLNRRGAARILLSGLVTALPLCTLGCDSAKQVAEPPNVLLISMDTTRADHLACYGHPEIETPNIDRLAREGTLFTQCTAVAPLTLPSHASILTGTYPFVHGVRDNGQFYLHGDNLTLTEVLADAGYATAAVVGAFVLNREYGLGQGFDVYDDLYAPREPGANAGSRSATQRPAAQVADRALKWLRANHARRFFLFVHFFDPHQPLEPPEPYKSHYRDPYLAEIAYTDAQIGRILDALKTLGREDDTLVVLTADHGEGRGQHREFTHTSFVYDTTQSVPLLFRLPGRIPAARRVDAQVRSVDIAPTILALLDRQPLADAQGVDLEPLLSGAQSDLELAAYSETMYPKYHFGLAWLRSLRADGWKYIHAPTPELYHVRLDPGELKNLAESEPERVAAMRARLRDLIAAAPAVAGSGAARRAMSPEAIAALRSVGYVAGGGSNVPAAIGSELDMFEPVGRDPKDYANGILLLSQAMSAVHGGDLAGAERVLRKVIEDAPDLEAGLAWAHLNLADLLAKQKKHEEALEHYRKALAANPGDGLAWTEFGVALAETNRLDAALDAYHRALEIKPTIAKTHLMVAVAYALKGNAKQAIHHNEQALEIHPNLASAHYNLALIYVAVGPREKALEACRKAVEIAPRNESFRRRLVALEREASSPGP